MAINVALVLINQIKSACPIFKGNVSGAAGIKAIISPESENLPVPAAYLYPLGSDMEQNIAEVGYLQLGTRKFGIAVNLDNTPDVPGWNAVSQIWEIEAQLIKAIAGFRPDPINMPRVVNYNGYQPLDINRDQFWCEFQFEYDFQISDIDVYEPVGTPLTEIDLQTAYENATVNANIPLAQS